MNPLRLVARNYRSFETLDLDLPDGCVAILGENGAGKSSIVNAIDLAIFGPESRSLADALTEGSVDELLVELEFEHAGVVHRVRRSYSPRGRGKATLDFERYVFKPDWQVGDPQYEPWEPLTCESAKATQELIERAIGLSRETFRASAFLAQGDGAAFTEAQPRDRKRILAEVIGLDRWNLLLTKARADRQRLEREQQELDGRIGAAQAQAALAPDLEKQLDEVAEAETVAADQLADLERSHAELAVEYQEAREHAARRQAATAELETAQAAMRDLDDRAAKADEAARRILEASEKLRELATTPDAEKFEQRIAELAAAVDAHERAQREHDFAVQQLQRADRERAQLTNRAEEAARFADAVRTKISDLEQTSAAICDLCGQEIHDDAKARVLAEYRAELQRHLDTEARERAAAAEIEVPVVPTAPEGEAPVTQLEIVRGQLRAAQQAATERATQTERIRQLELVAASGPSPDALVAAKALLLEKQDALTGLGEGKDTAAIERQGKLVGEQLRDVRAQLERHRQLRARLDERLQAARAAGEQVAAATADRERLLGELDTVVVLERAFSPDGIPALIVENTAIPYLETEANRILGLLGGKTAACQVELRTQAELKSGDGVRDTLDVVVIGQHGERPYETFSGGEKTRLNLALRIALARLLAHRRGAESRLLVVDEPDGLDDAGISALVDVLRGLEDDFAKLYVVSHVPALRDSFDTTLAVVSVDGAASQVVDAGVFAEVAA